MVLHDKRYPCFGRSVRLFLVVLSIFSASIACSSAPADTQGEPSRLAESRSDLSGPTGKLWVLNQSGDPSLGAFFSCILGGHTDWNDLANSYPTGRPLDFGGQVVRNDDPCTANVATAGFYQCAVNAGHFDVSGSDVVLVVIPSSGFGGQNGSTTLVNPVSGGVVTVHTAYVRTSPDPIYQTIYGGHEVFEAQTDGVSADCCDGETSTGGPFPWCASCGPYDNGAGACGRYASGGSIGTLGIDTIQCPGRTFKYQRVSPFGNEFDGTCAPVTPKSTGGTACAHVLSRDNGLYCGTSRQNGFAGGAPNAVYDCRDGQVASVQSCGAGCFVAPVGKPDGCNVDPCARVPNTDNGSYCGASRQFGFGGGAANTVYTCAGGRTVRTRSCAKECFVAPPGSPDDCVGNPCARVPASGNGLYCGSSTQSGFSHGAPNVLYTCRNEAVSGTKTCSNGCALAPVGQPDFCK